MGFNPGGPTGLQSEINVTPLVDVVLVLLIIFMVIVPLTLRGHDLDIPAGSSGTAATAEGPPQVVLRIDAQGCPIEGPATTAGLPAGCRVRLDGETIAMETLGRRLAETFEARAPDDRVLFLAADDRLNYEGVLRIVDAARSGIPDLRIGMVSD